MCMWMSPLTWLYGSYGCECRYLCMRMYSLRYWLCISYGCWFICMCLCLSSLTRLYNSYGGRLNNLLMWMFSMYCSYDIDWPSYLYMCMPSWSNMYVSYDGRLNNLYVWMYYNMYARLNSRPCNLFLYLSSYCMYSSLDFMSKFLYMYLMIIIYKT